MFSPSKLVKRVGVGGGLVPFFKCVCVYFAVGGGGGAGPSAAAAAAKCAPVLSLLLAVLLLAPVAPLATLAPVAPGHDRESQRYARRVALGLAASALGDALLEWPQHLAWGMAAFGGAHVCYSAAFVPRAPRRAAAAALFAAAALYVRALAPPPALAPLLPLVPPYAALLAAMAWRALRTLPAPPAAAPPRALLAPAGALLFLLSDAILGYTMFGGGGALPYNQVLVMSTYYLAQLALALSALLPPPAAPATAAPLPAATTQ